MGTGGAVYTGPSRRSTGVAERRFESAVEEVRESRIRNAFITFHTEDEAQVSLLRSQAKSEGSDLEFRDYSIKEPFDEQWKANCRERIAQTSATICMIGPETSSRPAVLWEIEESYRQGKKVIGVRIYRDANHPIPAPLTEHGAPIINWDLKEISRLLYGADQ